MDYSIESTERIKISPVSHTKSECYIFSYQLVHYFSIQPFPKRTTILNSEHLPASLFTFIVQHLAPFCVCPMYTWTNFLHYWRQDPCFIRACQVLFHRATLLSFLQIAFYIFVCVWAHMCVHAHMYILCVEVIGLPDGDAFFLSLYSLCSSVQSWVIRLGNKHHYFLIHPSHHDPYIPILFVYKLYFLLLHVLG